MASSTGQENDQTVRVQAFLKLIDVLQDPHILLEDQFCIWVRSRIGIVGMVKVDEPVTAQDLQKILNDKIIHAHSMLEKLIEDKLSVDDVWNLLLFIAVPWTASEISKSLDVAAVLARCARNLQGSRKIILYEGISPAAHVGQFNAAQQPWIPKIGDPLRGEIQAVAKTDLERDALQILFKRRITDEDLDLLIEALGQKTNT